MSLTETTVVLKVATAEAFGHSAAPAVCAEPGSEATITPTDPAAFAALGLAAGASVGAEVRDVWNPPEHHHSEEISLVAPTVEPEAPVVPERPPGCTVDGDWPCIDVAACVPGGPFRFDLPMGSVSVQVMGLQKGGACGLCVDGEHENPAWEWKGCKKKKPTCAVPTATKSIELGTRQEIDTKALDAACPSR